MKIRDLVREWQARAATRRAAREYAVRLPLHDAARLQALNELFPGRSPPELITDLLSAALDELEAALPYVQGSRVVARDEYDEPIYEDEGLSPRLHALTRKYERILGQESAPGDAGAPAKRS